MDIKDKDFGKVENYQSHITNTIDLTPLERVYGLYKHLDELFTFCDYSENIIRRDLWLAIKEVLRK